ncbi:MAG: DUF4493 domain-containing protein [Bacteroidaceae bacterium]|nr:DUF4493 domain-containing protein [Bacteroidaceae bacterium]
MNRYKVYMVLIAALTAFLMIGCQAENDPFDLPVEQEGTGRIALHITADGKMQTRAPKTLTDEQKNQYLITIRQGNVYYVDAKVLSQLATTDLTVPAGYGYMVMAESCSASDAISKPTIYGQPRLVGTSATFPVVKDETSTANVLCTPANAGVMVTAADETFNEIFSDYVMTVSLGSRELTFTPENASIVGYYNVSSTANLSYSLTATRRENGETASVSSTAVLQQGRITQLSLRSTPKGTITLGITYDDTFVTEDIEMVIDP